MVSSSSFFLAGRAGPLPSVLLFSGSLDLDLDLLLLLSGSLLRLLPSRLLSGDFLLLRDLDLLSLSLLSRDLDLDLDLSATFGLFLESASLGSGEESCLLFLSPSLSLLRSLFSSPESDDEDESLIFRSIQCFSVKSKI